MLKVVRSVLLLPVLTAVSLAGPPGSSGSSGGHSSGSFSSGVSRSSSGYSSGARSFSRGTYTGTFSPLSGSAPLGASGPAPLGAAGSLHPGYSFNGRRYPAGARPYPAGGRRGSRYPYAYFAGPFALPYGYGSYGDGYYDSAGYGPGPDYGYGYGDPQSAGMGPDPVGDQLQQLSAEVDDLRYQQQQQQSASSGASPSPKADSDAQDDMPITLVLHSGQQLSVKNYAVTNGVFWNFSKLPAQKIPVSAIDVPASEKATAATGGDFPPISN